MFEANIFLLKWIRQQKSLETPVLTTTPPQKITKSSPNLAHYTILSKHTPVYIWAEVSNFNEETKASKDELSSCIHAINLLHPILTG